MSRIHDHDVHHDHEHGGHEHAGHDHEHGGHDHEHPTGVRGFLYSLFVPHTHDAADAIDDAMEASRAGIRALIVSFAVLLVTTILQAVVFFVSGSVALLADTIHNFSDALTAVPLWVAFVLGRRAATRRYTYGFGRAEDLAGLFIVAVVALSAIVAAWQSIDRLLHPQPLHNVGWVIAAGVIGFAGNEAVAIYRIRVGRRIGSAALVADGVHARTDGFTSLAVVIGGIGVLLGFPLADPLIGLVISATIFVLLIGTVRSIGRRLMDGIEPDLLGRVEHALEHVDGVQRVERVRLRWIGHRLEGDALVISPGDASRIAVEAEQSVRGHVKNIDEFLVGVRRDADSPAA
ncbi:cation diffusion facilitator family transporter [Microbacterium rhizosphaerae]|uniref:Cation diffusion facilitator family transporter n=1 Tax=Microbacterium rhizosphaerae TaxID=1678237 RepID=A0ABZ0SL84_9MICO|nr:cation diffusion facilitator family transporter [Microbacterium rhizosphaerae]WPR88955.1 cation diffusion facilitator family transporter [Microbacterium rhizosphaerae]